MIFLRVLVWAAMLLLIVGFSSEVLVPLWRGTQLFPHLRKSKAREKVAVLQAKLEETEEEIEAHRIEEELNRRRLFSKGGRGGRGANGGGRGGNGGAPGQPGEPGESINVSQPTGEK